MSNPFVGEIRMFGGNFAPVGWLLCQGQTVAIADYEVLYTLIGTTYGGDGQTTFQLPNLQSRFPIHAGRGTSGSQYYLGQTGGAEAVTLIANQLPVHTHTLAGSSAPATTASPTGAVPAAWSNGQYSTSDPAVDMSASAYSAVGGNEPHDNLPPYLTVNFLIATDGIFPSQS